MQHALPLELTNKSGSRGHGEKCGENHTWPDSGGAFSPALRAAGIGLALAALSIAAIAAPSSSEAHDRQLTEPSSARKCAYRGALHSEGSTIYGDPCPGQACATAAGPLLACRDGSWVDTTGMSVCSAYAARKVSPLWTAMSEHLKEAQAAYHKSLGCPD